MDRPISHLAFIPDGNRRLAKRLLEQPWKGHEWGVEKFYTVFDWCREIGIRTVTFYALSLENLQKRPADELRFLFLLAKKELERILTDQGHQVHRHKIRVNIFGQLQLLPADLQEAIRSVMRQTKGYRDYVMNIAMAYGGRQEIVEAASRVAVRVAAGELAQVDEQAFREGLSTGAGDPDLIIRTGGERRLSNFLPFQSVYSELAFVDTFWPELTKEEFVGILDDFAQRERRFGE